MKYYSVDRFEGQYMICQDDNKKMFAFPLSELAVKPKEGEVISVDGEGVIAIDRKKTEELRGKVRKLQNSVWED